MTPHAKRKFFTNPIHNMDLSLVLVIEDDTALLKFATDNCRFLERNGLEVVVIVHLGSKDRLEKIITSYPLVNWKLIRQGRLQQNVSSKLNLGTKLSTKTFVMFVHSGVHFLNDTLLLYRCLIQDYPSHYVYSGSDNHLVSDAILAVSKSNLNVIGGFDESFGSWFKAIKDVKSRLNIAGIRGLSCIEAKFDVEHLCERFSESNNAIPLSDVGFSARLSDIRYGELIYDWKDKGTLALTICQNYLKSFEMCHIDERAFRLNYKKILLCQAYNEAELILGFIDNVTKYFDAIIFLDDGSDDNTWELAKHEKIIIKARKWRIGFNDLENRNILLNIASFLNSEWLCFLDIDERIDARYCDFEKFENDSRIRAAAFAHVTVWNSVEEYCTTIPNSQNGILRHARMFRTNGRLQINTYKSKLHFLTVPVPADIVHVDVVIKDLGCQSRTRRQRKYCLYIKEDSANDFPEGYNYLLDDTPPCKRLSEIELTKLTTKGSRPFVV